MPNLKILDDGIDVLLGHFGEAAARQVEDARRALMNLREDFEQSVLEAKNAALDLDKGILKAIETAIVATATDVEITDSYVSNYGAARLDRAVVEFADRRSFDLLAPRQANYGFGGEMTKAPALHPGKYRILFLVVPRA